MWLLPLRPAHKTGAVLGQVIEELTGKNQRTPLPCTLITMTTTINDHKSIPYITTDTRYNRIFKHSSTLLGERLCPCEVSVGSLSARLELNWDVACSGVEELMQDHCARGGRGKLEKVNFATVPAGSAVCSCLLFSSLFERGITERMICRFYEIYSCIQDKLPVNLFKYSAPPPVILKQIG